MMIRLEFLSGARKGETLFLESRRVNLGRGPDQDVVLPDSRASRSHACIERIGERLEIRDLSSTNGTFLNGVGVETQALEPGDQILIGDSLMRLTLEDGPREDAWPIVPDSTSDEPIHIDGLQESTLEASLHPADLTGLVESPSYNDFERLKSEHRKLLVVYQVMAFISNAPDVQNLMQRILGLIFQVIRADRGFVLVLDAETGELRPVARLWADHLAEERPRLSLSRTIVNHVVDRCEAVISADATSDVRFSTGESVAEFQIRSAMCVPIRTINRVWGIIHIDTAMNEGSFTPEDLELLTAIGQATGMAVENAELVRRRIAEERLATIGKTIAGLSHYIKNVLHGMRSGITLVELGQEAGQPEEVQQGLDMVRRYERRISDLVLNMLDYSKERRPMYKPLRLNHMIQDVAELARSRAHPGKLEFELDLSPGEIDVSGDPVGLHRALLNIALNAVDAVSEEGSRVSFRSRVEGEEAVIHIEDDGCGIAADQQADIFEMFYSTKGHGGTGIGLAVTRKIVQEHGGTIDLESREGEGTRFVLRLPLAPTEIDDRTLMDPVPGKRVE